jgi:hypothetical protein
VTDSLEDDIAAEDRALYTRRMYHRQIIRRTLLATFVLMLVVCLMFLGTRLATQIRTQWLLQISGFSVDWRLEGDTWTTGGVTRVTGKGWNRDGLPQDADLQMLPTLWNVESLNLTECYFTERGLAPLRRLDRLRELSFSRLNHKRGGWGPTGLGDACLVPIQGLTSLQTLTLSGNRITDSGLAILSGLSNLEILDLDATDVTDAGLVHLQSLKQLKTLNLTDTKVTPQGVKTLQAALPGLEISFEMEPHLGEQVKVRRR